jgi:probable HAF family extracellular repeat protein
MMRNLSVQLWIFAIVACPSQTLLGAEFRLLGKLRLADDFSDARAVSSDGSTVVGVSFDPQRGYEAVRWTSTGIESLGLGLPSEAQGVSADGAVVVGYRPIEMGQPLGEPIRWTANGVVGLGDLPGGLVGGEARDVSADGSVVVGSSSSERGGEAFRWTAQTGLVGLGLSPEGFRTVATAVSADGSVIVGNARTVPPPTFGDQAFRWTAANGLVGLGDLPGGGFYSEAFDVSADGSVVVGRSTTDLPTYSAFRWTTETGMMELPGVPGVGPFQGAEGISGDGKVIVGLGAMVWDEFHATRVLENVAIGQGVNLDGWSLEVGRAASYDGSTIVGLAFKEGVGDEAFLLRLDPGTFVPEPGTWALFAAAATFVAILLFCRGARRRLGRNVS